MIALITLILTHPYATISITFVATFCIIQMIKAAKGRPTYFDEMF